MHPLILSQEGKVNNIKTSIMPPLHCAVLSRSSFKHTLGCSNLWGSSLTSGDLHCSFAPAHLYQMISSSTSNLLTLIPHSQSTSTPPTSCFLPSCHSSSPTLAHSAFSRLLLLLLSISVSSQVCVGEFWDGGADRDSRAIPLKGVCACVFNMTSIQIKKD